MRLMLPSDARPPVTPDPLGTDAEFEAWINARLDQAVEKFRQDLLRTCRDYGAALEQADAR